MKTIVPVLVLFTILAGCKKDENKSPISTVKTISVAKNGSVARVLTKSLGSDQIVQRGICYSISDPSPTISDSVTIDKNDTGKVTCTIFNLIPHSKYYVRAYLKTNSEIVYGNALAFLTTTLLKDSVYYMTYRNEDYSSYIYRNKVTVYSDTVEIKLYYAKTDSFTVSKYYSLNNLFSADSTGHWYEFKRIGLTGAEYMLVNADDSNIGSQWGDKTFHIKLSDISYEEALKNPSLDIDCMTMIE